ncbi:hypothetical protein [uncultured Draconibacterium sp.]|uniref:hypothetical protein n=1 Tax=uncultured Draconibacterium sp. TaxID=1573823 RepID=UPI003217827B
MKKIILIINLLAFCLLAYSQKTIQEWGQMEENKFTKKFGFGTGIHYLKQDFKETGQFPKLENVGVLSYALFSPNPTQRNTSIVSPMQITGQGSSFLVDQLFLKAEPGIRQGLKSKSINYKTSEEYLDTDEKKDLFKNTEFKASNLAKASLKMASFFSGRDYSGDAKGTPDGYKYILQSTMDAKLWRAIGKFTGELEIDGLINVEQTIWWDGKDVALGPITMNLIIPNPFPYNEESWYAPVGPLKGYLEGVILASVTVNPPNAYYLGELSKKKTEFDFSELDVIYERIISSLIDYSKEEFSKYSTE